MANIGKTEVGAGSANIFDARITPVIASEAGTVESMTIWVSNHFSQSETVYETFRLAVYVGGVSNTNPTGATLLEDLGPAPLVAGPQVWGTAVSATNPTFSSGDRLWLGFKHYAANTCGRNYDLSVAGDFQHFEHRGTAIDPNPAQTIGWPSTISGSGTVGSAYPTLYLTYTPSGGGGTAPAAPSGLTATPISAQRNDLAWTDNATDEDYFVVERALDESGVPGTWEIAIASVQADQESSTDTAAAEGAAYWYRIKAVNAAGSSTYATTSAAITTKSRPVTSIDSPTSGSTIPTGSSITLEGSALDADDGSLTGSSLVWTSDVEGLIGEGNQVNFSPVNDGTHTIKLKATDSDADFGEDTIALTVGGAGSLIIIGGEDMRDLLYGTAATVQFELLDLTGAPLPGVAFAPADVQIIQDGVGPADTDNLPTEIALGVYSIGLTPAELSAARITIVIADQDVPALWLARLIHIETYGASGAQHTEVIPTLGTDDRLLVSTDENVQADLAAIAGDAASATALSKSASTIVSGAAVAGTLTTTQMSTDLTQTANDHFKGRILIFTGGTLDDQAVEITAYNGTTKVLTFSALTAAPSVGDTFVIV